MIYLDNGATSFWKPPEVEAAMAWALRNCANPGRGGYGAALRAGKVVYRCRETAAELFGCRPEQVVFTSNCTHGLNIALNSLIKPGDRVVISGFEHNAVTRTLHRLKAVVMVAGRRLFDPADTLAEWENALKNGAKVGITTHVSNVFGYILPVAEMAALCRKYGVPFVLDAAQSAGSLPVRLDDLGAAFIAMPGHKGLYGPQGTGLLLCREGGEPLLEGGTGSDSRNQAMPDYLPDRLEAGTHNVPGAAGLLAGMGFVRRVGRGWRDCRGSRCSGPEGPVRQGFSPSGWPTGTPEPWPTGFPPMGWLSGRGFTAPPLPTRPPGRQRPGPSA